MNKFSIPKITLYHLINELISTEKERAIFEIENKKITREKLYQDILNAQNYLIELKLNQKDTVISMLENSYEQITFFLATLCLGITWVPLGKDRKGVGLKYVLSITKPAVIFARKEKLIEIPEEYRKQIQIIKDNFKLKKSKNLLKKIIFNGEVNTILFTSGTTGPPKGVLVSDRMLIASAFATGIASNTNSKDKFLLWESLHHIGGIEILILCLMRKSKLVLIKKFSAKNFWKQIINYKITIIHYLGGILDILIKLPISKYDKAHKVKLAFGAGARIETYKIFKERFNIPLVEVYGMTEASSFTTINFNKKIGSIGKVLPWFNVKLKDKKKGIGEIIIRAKEKGLLTKGYFKDKKASSGLFYKNYLYTGDLGKFDSFKNLYYVGRKKDAVRVKGENISAWEIETTLNQNSNISESAIMATKSKIGEDDIIAVLLITRKINLKSVANYFSKKFSKNYQPRYWGVIKKFPRTPTFRIDKKNIKINEIKFYDFFEKKNVYLK